MAAAHSLFSPTFIIGHFRIGSVSEASCLNMGNNYPVGFQNNKKHNQGFGNVEGDKNHLSDVKSALDDSDLIDFLSYEDEDLPDWLAKLFTS